eukprot:Sro1256_g256670.2  (412) ;mRNA; f:27349-28584
MEPASACFDSVQSLPLNHLWPVPEYNATFQNILENASAQVPCLEEEQDTNNMDADTTATATINSKSILKDQHGRLICTQCKSLFCCSDCHRSFSSHILPDCCLYQKLPETILDVVVQHNTQRRNQISKNIPDDSCLADHWETLVATRIFCAHLTHLRRQQPTNPKEQDGEEEARLLSHAMQDMCGTASTDLQKLNVGLSKEIHTGLFGATTTINTVEPFYHALCQALALTVQEQQVLSLSLFERLVIVCSRNTLHVKTASPFTLYEERIKQQASSPEELKATRKNIAIAIGKSAAVVGPIVTDPNEFGTLQCCAVLPLFSRLNHACDPNLQVADRVVVMENENRVLRLAVDLVATKDIQPGEELSICYLSSQAAALEEPFRNRRLQSRYLFTCRCHKCAQEQQEQYDQAKK